MVPDQPWEFWISGYNAVLKVNDTDFRIYYDVFGPMGLANTDHGHGPRFFCVALSSDGVRYRKPDLGLQTYGGAVPAGSRHNNIVGRMVGSTVFLDDNPRTPPSERFKLVSHDVYGSPDGFVWTLLSAGHIGFSDSQTAAFFDPVAQQYYIYYRTHAEGPYGRKGGCPGTLSAQPSRSVGLFVTDNLTAPSWGPGDEKTEKKNLVDTVFNVDELDPPCLDFYTSAAIAIGRS